MLSEAQSEAKDAKSRLSQVETENSKLRLDLSSMAKDLDERTQQLLLFQRSIGVLPREAASTNDWGALKNETLKNVDLAKRLEEATISVQVLEEAKSSLERRLHNSSNWRDDIDQPSRPQWRTMDDVAKSRSREGSPLRSLPSRLRERTGSISSLSSITRSDTDSNGSDDLAQRKHTQNLRNEIEDLTTRLELSEMQRRRLESRSAPTHSRQNSSDGESLEARRLQRENVRLQDLVEEQAEKLATLEGPRALPTRDIQTTQKLEQNVKLLEQNKQKLMEQQNQTLRALSKVRGELGKVRASSQTTDRQLKS